MDDVMLTPVGQQNPGFGELIIPQPTRVQDSMLNGLGALGDPLWDFLEQRVFGIPVWAIGAGVATYFLLFAAKKSATRKAWEEA